MNSDFRVAFELQNWIWILCGENRCLSFSRQSSRGEREPLKLDSVAGRDFISIAIFNHWGIFSSAGRNLHLIGQCCFNGEFFIYCPLQEKNNARKLHENPLPSQNTVKTKRLKSKLSLSVFLGWWYVNKSISAIICKSTRRQFLSFWCSMCSGSFQYPSSWQF